MKKTILSMMSLLSIAALTSNAQVFEDDFAGGESALGFEARQPASAPEAVNFVTEDDDFFGYTDNPVANNPSGDSAVMQLGNLDGSFYGIAEAVLNFNDLYAFDEMTDGLIEAWVYIIVSSPANEVIQIGELRARTGLSLRDTTNEIRDSAGNGQESFPPQVHFDPSAVGGPGFGTSGFVTAVDDGTGTLVPVEGSSGYIIKITPDANGTSRTNDLFNETVGTTNRWVRMFMKVVGEEVTVGADINGDGVFTAGAAGNSEIAFYPSLNEVAANDPNDIGRPGCFTVVGDVLSGFAGVPDTPVYFDDVKITLGDAPIPGGSGIHDWNLLK